MGGGRKRPDGPAPPRIREAPNWFKEAIGTDQLEKG